MLTRIIRSSIQNGLTGQNRLSSIILNSSIVEKLRDIKPINSINPVLMQSRLICSTGGGGGAPSLLSNVKLEGSLLTPLSSPLLRGLNLKNVLVDYVPTRSVIKYTRSRGKRQTVKTVLKRFYRLNWGIWIRTKAGRHRRLWRKRDSNIKRARQHVFCNATQSWMLDKMVSKYWRKPKYWVDDPYNPYHTREEYWTTRKRPQP